MEFGLSLKQKEGLISIFDKHLKQGKVIVYGSRAKGNFTAQSDIDLVIQSSNATDRHLLATIHADIMESDFPYLCDIQYLEEIKSPRLLNHIKRMGKTFYQKESGMMEGWNSYALGDLADVSAGNSAPQDKALFKNGVHPFVRTADVGRIRFGKIASTSDYLNNAGVAKLRRFQRGTILFPKSGASTFLNHRVMMEIDGYVASHLATIQPVREKIHPWFLLYYLHTVRAQDLVQDHSYPSLNIPLIQAIQIPLPPFPEQKRIVAILDEAFAAIETATANTKKNLANARELFESELNRVFQSSRSAEASGGGVAEGWEQTTLGAVCEVIAGQSPKGSNYNDSGDGMPFYQGKKEFREKCIGAPTKWTTQVTREAVAGDILMSVRAPVGPINFATERICIGRGLASIRAKEQIHRDFLFYLLLSMQEQIKGNEGAVFASINKKQIENIKFVKPSLTEQKKISARLDKLSEKTQSLIGMYQTKLSALTELKQSLLHKAFTGELTADKNTTAHTLLEAKA